MLGSSNCENNSEENLVDLLLSPNEGNQSPKESPVSKKIDILPKKQLLDYFFEIFSKIPNGFLCGNQLIRSISFNFAEFIELNLFEKVVKNLQIVKENESSQFIEFLKLIPWNELTGCEECVSELLANNNQLFQLKILTPLKELVNFAINKKWLDLISTVYDTLLFISNIPQFSSIVFDFISFLFQFSFIKSIFICKLFLFPLDHLSNKELEFVFESVYDLKNNSLESEYFTLNEALKIAHRDEFIQFNIAFKLPNQFLPSSVSSSDSSNKYFQFVLYLFYKFAVLSSNQFNQSNLPQQSKKISRLHQIILQELFYFTFTSSPGITEEFSKAAEGFLINLIKQYPLSINGVFFCIGQFLQYFPSTPIDRFVIFLGSEDLINNHVISNADLYFLYSLQYFMNPAKPFPSFLRNYAENYNENSEFSSSLLNYYFNENSHEQSYRNLPQEFSENCKKMVDFLFKVIDWRKLKDKPTLRLHAVLLIIFSKSTMYPYWNNELLFDQILHQLLSPPYDETFLLSIITFSTESITKPEYIGQFELIKILLIIHVTESQHLQYQFNHEKLKTSTNYLKEFNFYEKLFHFMDNYENLVYLPIIFVALNKVKSISLAGEAISTGLNKVFGEIIKKYTNLQKQSEIYSLLLNNILEAFMFYEKYSNAENDAKNLTEFWFNSIFALTEKQDPFDNQLIVQRQLINNMIGYCFFHNYPVDLFFPLVTKYFNYDLFNNLHKEKLYWIILVIFYSMQLFTGSNSSPLNDQLASYQLIQKIGVELQNSTIAIPYWLCFFSIYFVYSPPSSSFPATGDELFPAHFKQQYLQFFLQVSALFENKNDQLHQIYKVFSTFNKQIIISHIQNHKKQLFEQCYALLPNNYQHSLQHAENFPIALPSQSDKPTTHLLEKETSKQNIQDCISKIGEMLYEDDAVVDITSSLITSLSSTQLTECIVNQVEIKSIIDKFHNAQNENGKEQDQIIITIIDNIILDLKEFNQKADKLEELDKEYLELSKGIYCNYQTNVPMKIGCRPDCPSAIITNVSTIAIQPKYENLPKLIESNREKFNEQYLSVFNLPNKISSNLFLFYELFEYIEEHKEKLVKNQEKKYIELFKIILSKTVEELTSELKHWKGLKTNLFILFNLLNITFEFFHKNHTLFPQKKILKILMKIIPGELMDLQHNEVIKLKLLEFKVFIKNNENEEQLKKLEEKLFSVNDLNFYKFYQLFQPQQYLLENKYDEYFNLFKIVSANKSNLSGSVKQLIFQQFHLDKLKIEDLENKEAFVMKFIEFLPTVSEFLESKDILVNFFQFLLSSRNERIFFSIIFNKTNEKYIPDDFFIILLREINFSYLHSQEPAENLLNILKLFTFHAKNVQTVKEIEIILELFCKFTADSETFTDKLISVPENRTDSPNNFWKFIFEFIKTLLENIEFNTEKNLEKFLAIYYNLIAVQQGSLSDVPAPQSFDLHGSLHSSFSASIHSSIPNSPPGGQVNEFNLLNYCWNLFSNYILSNLNLLNLFRKNSIKFLLKKFASDFHWENSNFLISDGNSILLLNNYLFNFPEFICELFSKLDWNNFMRYLNSTNKPSIISRFGLLYLKLFLQVNLISSKSISTSVRLGTILLNKNDENLFRGSDNKLQNFINWSVVDPIMFSQLFNGQLFLDTLKSGIIDLQDPSQAFVDNFFTLRVIALEINHPLAALACIREISSILFQVFHCKSSFSAPSSAIQSFSRSTSDIYWYLPFQSHIALITGVILPLTHQFASSDTQRETHEMVLSIISCLLHQSWSPPIEIPSPIGVFRNYPGCTSVAISNDDANAHSQFYEKIKYLILQFATAASPTISIFILQSLPPPSPDQSIQNLPQIGPHIWIELVEVSLRSFFSQDHQSALSIPAATALNISVTERGSLLQICASTFNCFTFLVLLYHWKLEIDSQWDVSIPYPTNLFETALSYIPPPNQKYDLFLIWFFIIELTQNQRFHPIQCQKDVFFLFFSSFTCKIFYSHFFLRNSHGCF